ncbi:MAG TPA: type II toxin-antitoxin system RelE/ParE family toxin [Pyrinomonadaceae bacterium]|nr:type II toxin-antitoxin system RelE/ParE family toxin [Pyrinomonadaceae bacterium]
MKIRFLPEADAELVSARLWYGQQRNGLDVDLMQRVDETLQRISNAPYRFPYSYRRLRRALVRQFPFAIYYEATKDEILVIAIFHQRRNPQHLTTRLKRRG